MRESLLSAPGERYADHIKLCLQRFEIVYPLFESTLHRLFNTETKKALKTMVIYHDLGKLTSIWQKHLNENKPLPPHASLGAGYLWKILQEGLKEPIAFAVAIHHTDRGLLSDNTEKPDVQAIIHNIADFNGKIKWYDKSEYESLPELLIPEELEALSINDLKEMARGLRLWAKGCPLLEQHKRRLQAALLHHILKLCDVSAASKRTSVNYDKINAYGKSLMVKEITNYVNNITERKRYFDLQSEVKHYISIIKEKYNPEKILLFGSLANGEVHQWSDIELVLIKDTNKPFSERMKEVLLLIKPKVDIKILVYTPEEFEQMKQRKFFNKGIISKDVIYE